MPLHHRIQSRPGHPRSGWDPRHQAWGLSLPGEGAAVMWKLGRWQGKGCAEQRVWEHAKQPEGREGLCKGLEGWCPEEMFMSTLAAFFMLVLLGLVPWYFVAWQQYCLVCCAIIHNTGRPELTSWHDAAWLSLGIFTCLCFTRDWGNSLPNGAWVWTWKARQERAEPNKLLMHRAWEGLGFLCSRAVCTPNEGGEDPEVSGT